jgi:tetratricopeptide (TPR) repeat protein
VRLIGPTPGGGRASLTRPALGFVTTARQQTYDAAVSIPGELERARRLIFAADEIAARDLLLSLVPQIEQADRDDFMLEVFAQLGEIYLVRGANDGVREFIRRIRDCVAIYSGIVAGTMPEAGARGDRKRGAAGRGGSPPIEQVRMSDAEVAQMICRYSRRAQFLETGLAAAHGDHEGAEAALAILSDSEGDYPDLADEHAYLLTYARMLCAVALCDDDLHAPALPLWKQVLSAIDRPGNATEFTDYLRVIASTGYGRFCTETGRLSEAEPWLRRAGARAQANDWELATARTQLERAATSWSAGDKVTTEQLVSGAYPVIARYARAHDVSRCWLYLGLTRLAHGALQAADQCWEHAERHWRELGRPLHIHRILLQRSWIDIFRGRFAEAVERTAQARECLDSSPRSSWLQYAQLDNHLGTVWRADALRDLGFDAAGDPSETWEEAQARQATALGVTRAEVGSPQCRRAMTKLGQAAELKVPAALAVDSVRYSIADADARSRWATCISAPILASAFAVAWEWNNTELISELIEYHSARGTFSSEPLRREIGREMGEWESTATSPILLDTGLEPTTALATAAAGPPGSPSRGGVSLTRLGPLPPLRMQPDGPPIMSHYRALALQRYGRDVTADEPAWSTWP